MHKYAAKKVYNSQSNGKVSWNFLLAKDNQNKPMFDNDLIFIKNTIIKIIICFFRIFHLAIFFLLVPKTKKKNEINAMS